MRSERVRRHLGGCVFDVDAIIEALEADWQVLAGDR
jgi:hypothetical protein